ncbi:MAG: S-layer homology domain-containing protein [Monoglobaceae bacterium]
MINVKKITAAISGIAVFLSTGTVFADVQSDAAARVQISNNNRFYLSDGLSGSGLTEQDLVSHYYVYEDFNNWTNDRATHLGHNYDGYSSYADRAKEKVGGLLPNMASSLPIAQRGDYGAIGSGQVIPGFARQSGATIGWFGSETDGWMGVQNNGSKGFISGTPEPIEYKNDDNNQAAYGAESDRLLYVGDNNGNGQIDVDDWLQFEGQIIVSYDWLVSTASDTNGELNLLQNYAIYQGPWHGTTGWGFGTFNITAMPDVYVNSAGKTMLKYHAGIEFTNNGNYNPDNPLLPWMLGNASGYYKQKEISGIEQGDWVNITVLLDVKGTGPEDRVITQREFINGELISNDNGETDCKIYPYKTDYRLSNNRPSDCCIEAYPVGYKESNGNTLDFKSYYGMGLQFTAGTSNDGSWRGIDNLCYRVYGTDTELESVKISALEINDGVVNIPVVNANGMPFEKAEVAPKAALAGVIDSGDNAKIDVKKVDLSVDPLGIDGQTMEEAEISPYTTLNLSEYVYEGELTGKKFNDASGLRIGGLEPLQDNEGYAIKIDTLDLNKEKFVRSLMVTDKSDLAFAYTKFFDYFENETTSEVSRVRSCEYNVSAGTRKMVFGSDDEYDCGVTVTGANESYTASFDGGVYTVTFDKPLKLGETYKILKNNTEVTSFVPVNGEIQTEVYDVNGVPTIKFVNSTAEAGSAYIVASNECTDVKAEYVNLSARTFGEVPMNTSESFQNLYSFADFKTEEGKSEVDSPKASVSPFEGTTATVKGNLNETDKKVTLVVFSGDKWDSYSDLASSVKYIDTANTKTSEVTTIDGVSPYADGDYEFNINFLESMPSGKYTFMVYSGDEAYKRVIAYSKVDDNAAALEILKTNPEQAINDEDTRYKLEFYYSLIENLYSEEEKAKLYSDISGLMKKELVKNPLPSDNAAAKVQAVSLYRQFAIMTALKDKKLSGLDNVLADIEFLSESPANDFWNNEQGLQSGTLQSMHKGVFNRLNGKLFDGIEDFEQQLCDALILETVRYAASKETVKNVLRERFDGYNTISEELISDRAAGNVTRVAYDDIDALVYALNLSASTGGTPGSSSSGSGSSGGRVGSVVIGDVSAPSVPEAPTEDDAVFNDIADVEWAREAILNLKEKGVINGRSSEVFDPDGLVTREEFVKMTVSLFDVKVEHGDLDFVDVSEDDWFYIYVKAAVQKDIIKGTSETTFGTGLNITREDMSTILYNALIYKKIALSSGEINFSDKDAVSSYAETAVANLTAAGILTGYTDNTFRPQDFSTRAEAAKLLYEVSKLLK